MQKEVCVQQNRPTLYLQRSIYVHLRLALLLCSCCGRQRGALVNTPLDVLEHHKHVVDPCSVARQLCDLSQQTHRGQRSPLGKVRGVC